MDHHPHARYTEDYTEEVIVLGNDVAPPTRQQMEWEQLLQLFRTNALITEIATAAVPIGVHIAAADEENSASSRGYARLHAAVRGNTSTEVIGGPRAANLLITEIGTAAVPNGVHIATVTEQQQRGTHHHGLIWARPAGDDSGFDEMPPLEDDSDFDEMPPLEDATMFFTHATHAP